MEDIHDIREWYIPGPVDVRPEVRKAMAEPPYGHRTPLMSANIRSISENMLKLVSADPDAYTVILIGGSGTNALETGARSFTSPYHIEPRVLVASIGYFGDLWADIFDANGIKIERMRAEDGHTVDINELENKLRYRQYEVLALTHNETSTGTTNFLQRISSITKKYNVLFLVDAVSSLGGVPIYPQELDIDYLVTSAQKCLGVPPGLGIAVVSEKAVKRAEHIGHRGYTTDIVELVKNAKKGNTLSTPAEAQIEALNLQLDYILNEEGPQNRYRRHSYMATCAREWAKEHGIQLFPDETYASDTVSCFVSTPEMNLDYMQQRLAERGYGFDPGYRKLNDELAKQGRSPTFRIAHMGDRQIGEFMDYLDTLSDVLRSR